MGNVYSLDTERNLILYRAGTNLYIRSTSGESMTRPVTLCTDYRDSLTDTTYNGTVYYAYRSTEQDLVVRSITDLQNIYKISSQEIPDCYDPRLVTFRDELVLFYATKSPLNSAYYLKAVFPLKPEKRIKLPETAFPETMNLGILVMSDKLILSVYTRKKQLLFSLNPAFEPIVYPSDSTALETQLDTAFAQLRDTQQKLDTAFAQLQDMQQKLDAASKALLDTQQKFDRSSAQLLDTQQRLDATTKELEHTKTSLRTQAQSHSETVESIRAQYNELMETATRYREEAVRWHDIACKRDARPIPGESLIADSW